MKTKGLLQQLKMQPNLVMEILGKLPLHSITQSEENIRFDSFEHNSQAYTLNMSTLTYHNFREGDTGTLIDLVYKFSKETDFNKVFYELYLFVCLKGEVVQNVEETETFTDFYTPKPLESYPKDSLDNYKLVISDLFLKDNLWITTQLYWKIRYDSKFKRVVIPVYQDNNLVGAIGRLNKKSLEEKDCKYLPTLRYNKSQVLFGLDEWLKDIQRTKRVVIVESEKSVMKAWQYRFPLPVLAIGCSNISRHHIEKLNTLGVKEITLALDKGIEETKVLQNNLKKLGRYSTADFIKWVDVDSCPNELLEDKECVFDRLSKEEMFNIFRNYTRKYRVKRGNDGE